MRLPVKFRSVSASLTAAAIAVLLTACGGSDDANPGAQTSAVSGTAAVGAPLVGAQVTLTCASGNTITGVTNSAGLYNTSAATIRLPCIGQATKAPITYRGVLFSGSTANFTPLTDILVEVILAAAAPGGTSMTLTQFLAKIQTDATFAANVSAPSAVAAYRNVVVALVRERLRDAGLSQALLGALLNANFESAIFAANPNDPLDRLLENLKVVLQGPDGNVLAAVLAAAKLAGDELPTPPSTGTGAPGTGGSGGTGGTGGT